MKPHAKEYGTAKQKAPRGVLFLFKNAVRS